MNHLKKKFNRKKKNRQLLDGDPFLFFLEYDLWTRN